MQLLVCLGPKQRYRKMNSANFSPRQNRRWLKRVHCVVNGCDSVDCEGTNIRFHRLPLRGKSTVTVLNHFGEEEKIDKLDAWKRALKIKDESPSLKVCSLHFTKNDYSFPDLPTSQRHLKMTAIPSCNLPGKSSVAQKARLERKLRRWGNNDEIVEGNTSSSSNTSTDSVNSIDMIHRSVHLLNLVESREPELMPTTDKPPDSDNIYMPDIECNNSGELVNGDQHDRDSAIYVDCTDCSFGPKVNDSANSDNASDLNFPTMNAIHIQVTPTNASYCKTEDKGVQTESKFRIISLIKTQEQLSTATGLESFEILDVIVKSVMLVTGNRYEKKNDQMHTRDRVMLTLMKLKQNLSYSFLAILFCISDTQCRNIFYETITTLAPILELAIPWPSREEIRKNIPECFKGFEDVRVVLDCTEVKMQRPKNLCCQVTAYSNYKSDETVKIMTGVDPSGAIVYKSSVYGGRASDTAIFSQSSLMTLLEPEDAIMVDRGFLIDKICEENQWKLVRPPFLRDKKQFSVADNDFTRKVASARVHVERSNQRIKTFKILSTSLPTGLIPIIDEIFTVICGIINLSSPILGDNRFMFFKESNAHLDSSAT